MKKALLLLIAYCITNIATAQPIVGFSEVATGLTNPVDVANSKDGTGRLFIVEQGGTIRIYNGATILPTPFLNVSSLISGGGERGLLSVAFHPLYATNRYFFIYYTNTSGDITVAQYQTPLGTPNVADPLSGKVLLNIPKPFANHNGGKLNFGPDGNLYFGTGDGGSGGDPGNNAQTGSSNLGKLIRINVDDFTTPPYYTIPPTNPFIADPTVNDEIFAVGLRNPWRWSFDKLTGDMWIADVGQGAWEEVNVRTPANMSGVNYGWRCFEGAHNYDLSLCTLPLANYVPPIFEYPHNGATGGFAITGGYVYRGTEFTALQGYYICCDYITTNGWIVKDIGGGVFSSWRQNNFPANVSAFGEAEDGTLYTLSTTGSLSKIILAGVLPLRLISFTAQPQNGKDLLQWKVATSAELSHFEIERSSDGIAFQTIGTVTAQVGATGYQFNVSLANTATRFYRLKLLLKDGSVQYSGIVNLNNNFDQKIIVRYAGTQQLQVFTPVQLKQLRIVNNMGQVLKTYSGIASGSQYLPTGNLLPGVYWVQCFSDTKMENFKIVVVN